jgi:EAL domain-containing protein (putative c-di-GMP-specific phosphodiesterase class I)
VLFEYVRRKRAEAAIDRACVATALAEAALLPGATMLNVNVHASTLARDLGFPAFLLERAVSARIAPQRLVVEIVEHAPPLDVPGFRRALEEMREGGLTIALDDVGLGQSNYKMILDVRPDIYKLDRYLVAGAWNDPYRQVILDSLARMVRRLEAKAVAEGVEDQNELVAVEAAGIDLVQGFLFARPLPRRELLASGFLAGHAPLVAAL